MTQNVSSWQADVVVLGSGGAALAAAVTAAAAGLKVIVLERDRVLGGTSAISGGALWIFGSRQAIAGGYRDTFENARTYLQHVIGDAYCPDIVEAFLQRGAEALAFLENHSALDYKVRPLSPDYYPNLPGATDAGRALEAGEFDGKRLGSYFALLRTPPQGMMGFGGMMVNRIDIYHFLHIRTSLRSLLHMARLTLHFCFDRLRYPRGTRLVIGNGMIAALLRAALDRGVEFHLGVETQSFLTSADGVVAGVEAQTSESGLVRIHARHGVILGTGGLSRRPDVLEFRPGTRADHLTMAAPKADGSMISIAERQLGAQVGGNLRGNFYWAPMSEARGREGTREVFPHIVTDRAKPGIIAVSEKGRRFVNEAHSYHRFVEAMIAEQQNGISRFYLIADRKALHAYGLGLVRPILGLHGKFLESGYLIKAASIPALAARLEIDPAALLSTIEEFNRDARAGVDTRFHKGNDSYNRHMGDSSAKHPCLAPLNAPPFYAVRIVTGDLGSAMGLMTDAHARVLRPDGCTIPGLYAVGTDMNSVVGGTYPGAGIVLGTGLTFGYIAGQTLAEAAGKRAR
ncbi:MAG TPA: FAD-dependent oxidoreductase [Bryobacteraceae bacterium]|nr:FAD-dependent oxidoreductase [Bryobacteraceae bacterium]